MKKLEERLLKIGLPILVGSAATFFSEYLGFTDELVNYISKNSLTLKISINLSLFALISRLTYENIIYGINEDLSSNEENHYHII